MHVQPKFASTYIIRPLVPRVDETKELRDYITDNVYLNFITGYHTLDTIDGDTEADKKLESMIEAANRNLREAEKPELEWYKSSVRLRDLALSILGNLFGALDMTERNHMTVNPRKTDYTDQQLHEIEYDRANMLPRYGEIKEALVRGEELEEQQRRDREAQR